MARLRHVDIRDYTLVHDDPQWREALRSIEQAYSNALLSSGLHGAASMVSVALHPATSFGEAVEVLVQCDKPDGPEIITADLPEQDERASLEGRVALVLAVLDAGLIRLGIARGWQGEQCANALQQARATVEASVGVAHVPCPVSAHGRGTSAPEQPHEILICGGGPTNGVPKAYLDELTRLLDIVATQDEWNLWWANSPIKLAEVFYWFDASKPGVRVRLTAKVTAAIERPSSTMRGTDPVELARNDATALTLGLAKRLQLAQPPALT